jgi:tetratricopeptide (TPR) repeat protein
LEHFGAARTYPHNLGEGKHLLTQEVDLDYFCGVALRELGRNEMARNAFRSAAESDPASPWMCYYKAMALRSLGMTAAADEFIQKMTQHLDGQRKSEPGIDYFATSLPNFLVFEDDLALRKEIECAFSEALVELALGNDLSPERKLKHVVEMDPNNLAAQTMLARPGRTGERVIESASWLAK